MTRSPPFHAASAARAFQALGRYRGLAQNLGFSGLTSFSNLLVVVVTLIAARVLGREDFGALAYAQSLAIIVMTPVSFGLDHIVMRELARRRELAPHYLFNLMVWAGILALALLLLLAAATYTVFETEARLRLVVLLAAAAWGLRVMALSAQVYFRPFNEYGRESVIAIAGQLVYLVLGLAVLAMGMGLVAFSVAVLLARIGGFLIALISVQRRIGMSYAPDPDLVLRLQKLAVPIGISVALTAAYMQIDVLILRAQLGLDDVGVYGAALKVYMALFMLPVIVTNVLLPRLSSSYVEENRRRYHRLTWGGGGLMLAISLPMAVLGVLVSPWIMETAFGAEYAAGARALQLLFVAAAISFQVQYARTLFIVIDRQRMMIWITLLGLVVRAGLVYWLSPIWGITGAAIAVLISECAMLAGCWSYLAAQRWHAAGSPVRSPGEAAAVGSGADR